MVPGRAIGLGLVAAAVAVAVWLTLSWLMGMTLLLLAIVVAGCVGAGVGIGNKGQGGMAPGLAAGVIAVCAALVGRFYAVQFAFIAEAKQEAAQVGEEDVLQYFEEHALASGRASKTDDEESSEEWAWGVAHAQWNRMSEGEQQEHIAAMRQQRMEEASKMDFGAGLLLSVLTLRIFDFVCIGLSASTAFASASRKLQTGIAADSTVDGLKPGQTMVLEESPSQLSGPFARLGRQEKDKAA